MAVVEEEKEEDNSKEVVDDEFGIDDDYNEEFRHEERQTKRYLHKDIFPSKHLVKICLTTMKNLGIERETHQNIFT